MDKIPKHLSLIGGFMSLLMIIKVILMYLNKTNTSRIQPRIMIIGSGLLYLYFTRSPFDGKYKQNKGLKDKGYNHIDTQNHKGNPEDVNVIYNYGTTQKNIKNEKNKPFVNNAKYIWKLVSKYKKINPDAVRDIFAGLQEFQSIDRKITSVKSFAHHYIERLQFIQKSIEESIESIELTSNFNLRNIKNDINSKFNTFIEINISKIKNKGINATSGIIQKPNTPEGYLSVI